MSIISKDDIVKFAVRCGLDDELWLADGLPKGYVNSLPMLEQFAGLVEAAILAKLREGVGPINKSHIHIITALERCVEAHYNITHPFHSPIWDDASLAIRELKMLFTHHSADAQDAVTMSRKGVVDGMETERDYYKAEAERHNAAANDAVKRCAHWIEKHDALLEQQLKESK
jgi:hypothetical protein